MSMRGARREAREAGAAPAGAPLLARVAALSAAQRAGVLDLVRAHLGAARERAREALEAGGPGLACAGALSAAMDEALGALLAYAGARLHPAENPSRGERLSLVAVGGYGRGTLAPGSDVDLLLLLPPERTPWAEAAAEATLYLLWDLGLKVGHATRSVEECLKAARADVTVRTALLEARLVAGDAALFEDLARRFDAEVVAGTGAAFAREKLEERDRRLKAANASRYLVEPDVKEGKGGLRDLNTLFWIAKYIARAEAARGPRAERAARDDRPEALLRAGLFEPRELALFRRCEDFLWRVRCHLHFLAGRAEERLSFDLQRGVAARIGYREGGALRPVERFMRHYFLVAKDVGDLTAILCAALEEREAKPRAALDRFVGALRLPRRRGRPAPGFVVDHGRLNVEDDGVFARDPLNLLRLFHIADARGLAIHPDADRLVTRSLRLVDASVRESPEANRLFLEVLCSPRAPEAALRHMHEAGVLGRFVPEFGRVQAMMQHSLYHHYTVDEHTLRAIGHLASIEAGRLADEHPLVTTFAAALRHRRALRVALFLHDVGKGRPEPHEVVGARIARELGPRLGLDPAEVETAAWLVEHHLSMSATAQTRDVADPRTISAFVAEVQTLERLRLLLVLTVCDISAVGPGVWNGWKGQLLRALYAETELHLADDADAQGPDRGRAARADAARGAVRALLPDWSDEGFAAQAARLPASYWLRMEPATAARHARLMARAEAEGQPMATQAVTDAFRGVTEITVLALDHPRLLAIVTGACAAAGADIVAAEIATTSDGRALDTLLVRRAFERDEDELRRADRVAAHVVGALKGEARLPAAIADRAARARAPAGFPVAPEVVVDNRLSARHTVVEVTGRDRPGLLHDLTAALGRLNLNIASARIATYGEKAVDVFYVADLTGGKVLGAGRQAAVRRRLSDVLAPRPDGEPGPAPRAGAGALA